jgi:hypothetical protein
MPITPTVNNKVGTEDGSVIVWTWVLVTATPDGSPLELVEWADRTWTGFESGDAAGGATWRIEGSNDGTNWYPVKNAANGANNIEGVGAAAMGTAIENPRYMRPNLSVAGAGASITVRCCVRRANNQRT